MKNAKYLMLGVGGVLIVAFIVGAYWYQNREQKETQARTDQHSEILVRSYHPTLGPENAKVTVVEFFDPECEACRAVYPLVKDVMKKHHGKVRLVLRYMPFHQNSVYAGSVLEAARKQGKYWEALELIFEKQPEWASHQNPKPELLLEYMKTLGLNIDAIKASLEDGEVKSKIQQDQQDGMQIGVRGTPMFFVNGKPLARIGYNELNAAIEEERNKP